MRFILGLAFTILLSSCATTTTNYYRQTVQSWHGAKVNTLVKRWGAPDRMITGPNGNALYVYQTQNYRAINTSPASPSIAVNLNQQGRTLLTTMPNINMTWNRGSMSTTCITAFEVAKNGSILGTQIQGSHCYGNENFAKRMINPTEKIMYS